jgi:hypothetical protein
MFSVSNPFDYSRPILLMKECVNSTLLRLDTHFDEMNSNSIFLSLDSFDVNNLEIDYSKS